MFAAGFYLDRCIFRQTSNTSPNRISGVHPEAQVISLALLSLGVASFPSLFPFLAARGFFFLFCEAALFNEHHENSSSKRYAIVFFLTPVDEELCFEELCSGLRDVLNRSNEPESSLQNPHYSADEQI